MMMNVELERRKEFERRRKLRLIQVRQQSKEFADNLRERIKGEITKQKEKYLEAENKLKQEKHLQELCHLKELYDRCLGSIGEGHKEAAKQPDLNLEKESERIQISAKANERGVRALKNHLEHKEVQRQRTEAPVKQKKAIRKKENLRACYIASLPSYAENYKPHSQSAKTSQLNTETQETRRVLQEIPSNLTRPGPKVLSSKKENSPEKPSAFRKDSRAEERREHPNSPDVVESSNVREDGVMNVTSPRDCSCDYIVCPCHQSPRQLRRSSSESRISEKVFDFEEPKRRKVRSRSCSPRSVRTLNYLGCGNVFESNQPSSVRVTHHTRSPKETEGELVLNTEQEVPDPKPSVEELKTKEELKKRTDERCAKALRKEKLKRDFQQLIENLKKLTKEKSLRSLENKGKPRVYASERDILLKKETKQKKLNDAFERLPLSLKSRKAKNKGAHKAKHVTSNDSSPPTLNLALCQTDMPQRVVDFNIASSPSPPQVNNNERRISPKSTQSVLYSDPNCGNPTQVLSSPQVLVDKDPTGDVYITVKVNEPPCSQAMCNTYCPDSESSYMSPPMNLTPSQQELLNALLCQVNKKGIGMEMKMYIEKLLNMSRESIEQLYDPRCEPKDRKGGHRSDRRDGAKKRDHKKRHKSPAMDPEIQKEFAKLNELAEVYAKKVNTLVDMYEQMTPSCSPSTPEYVDPPCIPRRPSREDLSYMDRCYTPPDTPCEDPCYRPPNASCQDPCSQYAHSYNDPCSSTSPPYMGQVLGPSKDPCSSPAGPTPRTIQSGSPTPRQGVSFGRNTPSPGYGNICQPPSTPCPSIPTPVLMQDSYGSPERSPTDYQDANLMSYKPVQSPVHSPCRSRSGVKGKRPRGSHNPPPESPVQSPYRSNSNVRTVEGRPRSTHSPSPEFPVHSHYRSRSDVQTIEDRRPQDTHSPPEFPLQSPYRSRSDVRMVEGRRPRGTHSSSPTHSGPITPLRQLPHPMELPIPERVQPMKTPVHSPCKSRSDGRTPEGRRPRSTHSLSPTHSRPTSPLLYPPQPMEHPIPKRIQPMEPPGHSPCRSRSDVRTAEGRRPRSTHSPSPTHSRPTSPLHYPPQPTEHPFGKRVHMTEPQPTLTLPRGQPPSQGFLTPYAKYPSDIHPSPGSNHLGLPTNSLYPPDCSPNLIEAQKSRKPTEETMFGLQTITECQEYNSRDSNFSSSSLGDSTLDLIFGGIPGVPVPSKAELERRAALAACVNLSPKSQLEDFDLMEYFNEKQEKILRAGEQPDRILSSPECVIECNDGNQDNIAAISGFDMSALKSLVDTEKLIHMRENLANRLDTLIVNIQGDKENTDRCDSNEKSRPDQFRFGKDDSCCKQIPSTDKDSPTASKECDSDPGQKRKCRDAEHRTQNAERCAERRIPALMFSVPPDLTNIQNLLLLADSQERYNQKSC